MNLLLDTHVLPWSDRADKALNAEARALIADPSNQVFISAAAVVSQFERHPPLSEWEKAAKALAPLWYLLTPG